MSANDSANTKPQPEKKPQPSTTEKYFDMPVAEWPRRARFFSAFAYRVVLGFGKLYWRWSVSGKLPFCKNGRPAGELGRVFICNHASMFDPAFLVAYAGVSGEHMRPLYKSELDENKFVSWFFARVGAIPLKRGTADTKAIKRAIAALKRGENVLIFPEGTRIWDPEARPEVFGGFSLIALMSGADVVPVAIDGTERINPNKRYKLPRPSRVRVLFGEPMRLADMPGEGRKEKAAALETQGMERVYAMRGELRSQISK